MLRKSLKDPSKSVRLFLLLFVTYALVYMTKNCFSAAMASIVAAGVMTKSQTGLISAAFYLVYAPFQIVGGIAADRFSPAKLLLVGFLGAGICNLLIFFVESYVGMIIIWSLNAAFQFGIWPSVFKIVTTELHPEHRTKGVYYSNFTTTAGMLISYAVAIFVKDWRYNFLVSAIALFASFIVFLLGYSFFSRSMTEDESSLAENKKEVEKKSAKELILLIVKAGFPLIFIVNIIQCMINLGVKALAPTMLMESYENLTPALANALNIILVIAMPLGLMISRLPVFRKMSETYVVAILIFTMIPSLFIITFVGKISVIFIVAALALSAMSVASIGMLFSYIGKKFAKFGCSATLIGSMNCMNALGVVIANFVFARVADRYGWGVTTRAWFIIIIAAFIIMLALIPIFRRFEKKYLNE